MSMEGERVDEEAEDAEEAAEAVETAAVWAETAVSTEETQAAVQAAVMEVVQAGAPVHQLPGGAQTCFLNYMRAIHLYHLSRLTRPTLNRRGQMDSGAEYSPLYLSQLALTQNVKTPVEEESERLKSIINAANADDTTDTYLLVEVPFVSDMEGIEIVDLANSLQQRVFMNAAGVEMRCTVVRNDMFYNATLIVKSTGAEKLQKLYGNDYKSSDMRATEQQCARLFESEFVLLSTLVSRRMHAKRLALVPDDTDAAQIPAYVHPVGLMTVYFVETGRGHEMDLFKVPAANVPRG